MQTQECDWYIWRINNCSKIAMKVWEMCLKAIDQDWGVNILHVDAREWWISLDDKDSSKTVTKLWETHLDARDQEWGVNIVCTDTRAWWMCLEDKVSLQNSNESMKYAFGGNILRSGSKDSVCRLKSMMDLFGGQIFTRKQQWKYER